MFVEPGGELIFDPDTSSTVRTTGNVVVLGALRMRPASADVVHRLIFEDVDEDAFVGGGHVPLPTDVGLWVVGSGVLDLKGSPRRAWTRVMGDVDQGARRFSLEHDPTGWRAGDELVVTPTLLPTEPKSSVAFDEIVVRDVQGRTIDATTGARFDHPEEPISGAPGAEVLNLTRNVLIEGTVGGRSHVFVHSTNPQRVVNAAIRHMGPRQEGDAEHPTASVLGRYGLHLHECFGHSRGTEVAGVVIRDCGGHCFVAHNSHGVTFRDCISYNTWDEPYWWDPPSEAGSNPDNFSNGITYERCVAALVRGDPNFRATDLAGFSLGASTRKNSNRCVGCVAVGVRGLKNASGFTWPEDNEGIWVFRDCVAHNNAANGIFVWQNTEKLHVIENFVAYRNDIAGIEQGAYFNAYRYDDIKLVENRVAGVIQHARSLDPSDPETPGAPPLQYRRPLIDGGGITRFGFLEGEINSPQKPPAEICGATIRGVDVEVQQGREGSPTFDLRESC